MNGPDLMTWQPIESAQEKRIAGAAVGATEKQSPNQR